MSEKNQERIGRILQFPQSRVASRLLQPEPSTPFTNELADYFERQARLAGNNAVLMSIGKAAVGAQFVGDASGLDAVALHARIEMIDGSIEQQQQLLQQHLALAAAAAGQTRAGFVESPSIAMESN